MDKTIGVAKFQAQFNEVFEDVVHGRFSYVLARDEQPQAVLIAYEDFLRLLKLSPEQERFVRDFNRLRAKLAEQNAEFSDEEIEADIEAARNEVYEERARAQAAGTR